jgi:hypothetical protein
MSLRVPEIEEGLLTGRPSVFGIEIVIYVKGEAIPVAGCGLP